MNVNQQYQILAHLKSGKSITPIEALNLYQCFRLGARIYDLKQDGHAIEKIMVPPSSAPARAFLYATLTGQRRDPPAHHQRKRSSEND